MGRQPCPGWAVVKIDIPTLDGGIDAIFVAGQPVLSQAGCMSDFGMAVTLGFALAASGCGAQRGGVGGPDSGSGGTNAGDAGDAGASGIDTGPDAILAPVRVIRGNPVSTFLAATFEARGWPAEDDGRLVMLRLGHPDRPPERLASAEARIEKGAFRITVPMGSEQGLYQQKVALVDIDGDGACTQGLDRLYLDNSSLISDLTFVLAGSVPEAGAGERTMSLTTTPESAAAACAAMNLAWPDS